MSDSYAVPRSERRKRRKEMYPTSIRMSGEMRDFLQAEAFRERRTVTWIITDILESYREMRKKTGLTLKRRRSKAMEAQRREWPEPTTDEEQALGEANEGK